MDHLYLVMVSLCLQLNFNRRTVTPSFASQCRRVFRFTKMDSKRNHHGNKVLCFPIHVIESEDDSGDDILCPCGRPNHEENTIGCDMYSLHCNVKWYHFSCAGIDIKNVLEGEWLHISCRKS